MMHMNSIIVYQMLVSLRTQRLLPSTSETSSCLRRGNNSIWHLRLDIRHHPQQILNHLVPLFAPSVFDAFQLLVGIFTGVFFGFLVATRVLDTRRQPQRP